MKKNLLTLILLITAVCWSNNAFAQPANNECSMAADIAVAPTGGIDLLFGNPYDNTDATSEASDPADPGFPDTDSGLTATTWYTFTGDGGTYFIYTSNKCSGFELTDEYIELGDTQMAIYTGECGDLTLVAASEDNFMVPDYDVGNFAAGIVLETEAGVNYKMMIDGYDTSRGAFCITTTDALPAPCDSNVDIDPNIPTEVFICPTDEGTFAVDQSTLSYGPAEYIDGGQTSIVMWIMTSADPMGFDPLLAPETEDIFVGIFTDLTTTDYTLPGTSDGLAPITGAAGTMSDLWFTPYILNYNPDGSLAFANCGGVFGTTPIHLVWLADGEGDCADLCGEANVDLAEGTPTDVVLCLGDELLIAPNEATINYGGLVGANPVPAYFLNGLDPMGDPLGAGTEFFGFLVQPDGLLVVGDGIVDTLYITITLFEDYDDVAGAPITFECAPYSETVRVIYLAEDDPACAEVACEIEAGDAGTISTEDETTICVDGEPDVISFTSSYAGAGNYGYVVTDDATGEILTPGVVGDTGFSNDFDGAGIGICNVWGITWEGDVADAFVMGANVVDVLAGLGEDACYDLTGPLAVDRQECLDPLATGDASTSVGEDSYTVSFDIMGGSGNYSADGGSIENGTFTSDPIECGTAYSFTITDNDTGESAVIAGDAPCELNVEVCPIELIISEECVTLGEPDGGTVNVMIVGGTAPYTVGGTFNDVIDGNSFSFDIADNEEYSVEVTGSGDCTDSAIASGQLPCSKCLNVGGTLGIVGGGSATACGGNSISVEAVGGNVTEGSIIVYTLAGTNGDVTNSDGVFTRDDAGGSGTFTVTAMIGKDEDEDGVIDFLGDECTVESASIDVTFADATDLDVTVQEDCDQDAELVTVNVTINGADGATYDVSGTYVAMGEGSSFSFSGIADGATYEINIVEVGGCGTFSLISDPVICQKEDAVEWLSFDGEVQAEGNFLQWATASETNNEYFAVERSLDGKNFEVITTVKAVGESVVPTSYNYLDRSAPAGTSYYRVTQFDFDGQNEATNVISLTRGEGSFDITNIRPVPAADYIEVSFTAINNGTVELSVYDLTGRVMMQTTVEGTAGTNNQVIDVSTYPGGIYMVSLNNGTEVATQRLVKE